MEKYHSEFVRKLYRLYEQHGEELASSKGMWGMLFLSLRGEIPGLLQMLDEDEEMRGKVEAFIKEVAATLAE